MTEYETRGTQSDNINNFFSREDIGGHSQEAFLAELALANLKIKLKLFREELESTKSETPGPQTEEWMRKFDEIVGKI